MIEIKPIQYGITKSYIHNRPFEGIRNDFGNRELFGLSFDKNDSRIINDVMHRKTRLTSSAKKLIAYRNKKCR